MRTTSFLLILATVCLAIPTPLHAQTHEQKVDAVHEFKRFFRLYKEVAQRVEAVHALESADCPEAVDALLPILSHKELEVRDAAKIVISQFKEPATFTAMIASLEDMKDRNLRASLIDVLSLAKQKQLKPLLKMLWEKNGKRFSLAERYQTAKAFERLGGGGGYEPILATLARDKAFEVRVAALDAIRVGRLKKLGPELVALLHDSVWQVQAAAIQCHGTLRTPSAVDPLIEMLKDKGRLIIDASEALFKITAYDFGADYEMWRRQWDKLSKLPGFRLPTDEELAKAEESRKKYAALYGKMPGSKRFGGIPTTSTRVIFIIDVSASMDDLIVDREKFREGNYPSFKKLDIVKTELMRTIQTLDRHTWFNILAFASKVKAWKRWLTPGSINYKASALSFVKSLQPIGVASGGPFSAAADGSGKTNTYEALLTAFDLDPAKGVVLTGKGKGKALKLDTIFFLTDGRPSIGKHVDTEDILKEIKKINETRKVVIHTISIGEFEASFLRRLARDNGGTFVNLGG